MLFETQDYASFPSHSFATTLDGVDVRIVFAYKLPHLEIFAPLVWITAMYLDDATAPTPNLVKWLTDEQVEQLEDEAKEFLDDFYAFQYKRAGGVE